MKFLNVIFTMTNEVTDSIAMLTQVITESFSKLSTKNDNGNFYQLVQQTDKEKITDDFKKIGNDMFLALGKYEAKHDY
ncbi:hypothetical protein [Limosilactobacillus ingluviei]|uniref:hypothetical protein n=1 Tax=Limosilactobacillus ingluviei TaxID=148604 RepID=UPI00265DCEDD|nr:hypothetical protein [Limosilactobacillus ingluviei]